MSLNNRASIVGPILAVATGFLLLLAGGTLSSAELNLRSLFFSSTPARVAADEVGWLGVQFTNGPRRLVTHKVPTARAAAVVVSIIPGTPAEAAGLQRGDVVVSVDGETFADGQGFIDAIQRHPGETVSLHILRKGACARLSVTLDSRSRREINYWRQVARSADAARALLRQRR